jgi:hypothetical protein
MPESTPSAVPTDTSVVYRTGPTASPSTRPAPEPRAPARPHASSPPTPATPLDRLYAALRTRAARPVLIGLAICAAGLVVLGIATTARETTPLEQIELPAMFEPTPSAGAPAPQTVAYTVVGRWQVEGFGYQHVVVIKPSLATSDALAVLARQLHADTESVPNAAVYVFDDHAAAKKWYAALLAGKRSALPALAAKHLVAEYYRESPGYKARTYRESLSRLGVPDGGVGRQLRIPRPAHTLTVRPSAEREAALLDLGASP